MCHVACPPKFSVHTGNQEPTLGSFSIPSPGYNTQMESWARAYIGEGITGGFPAAIWNGSAQSCIIAEEVGTSSAKANSFEGENGTH